MSELRRFVESPSLWLIFFQAGCDILFFFLGFLLFYVRECIRCGGEAELESERKGSKHCVLIFSFYFYRRCVGTMQILALLLLMEF